MGEKLNDEFESTIDRKIIRVTYKLGATALVFDYNNTRLYDFANQYHIMRHVFRTNDPKPGGTYYFADGGEHGFDELYEVLQSNGFPEIKEPYPSLTDEKTWHAMMNARLERDLAQLEED